LISSWAFGSLFMSRTLLQALQCPARLVSCVKLFGPRLIRISILFGPPFKACVLVGWAPFELEQAPSSTSNGCPNKQQYPYRSIRTSLIAVKLIFPAFLFQLPLNTGCKTSKVFIIAADLQFSAVLVAAMSLDRCHMVFAVFLCPRELEGYDEALCRAWVMDVCVVRWLFSDRFIWYFVLRWL